MALNKLRLELEKEIIAWAIILQSTTDPNTMTYISHKISFLQEMIARINKGEKGEKGEL